jgi:hypothetical protein
MLRLANDQSTTEHERDTAMRMVHTILAKYNLDLAEIEGRDPQKPSSDPRMETRNVFYGRPWARQVCRSVARLFYCRYLYASIHGKKDVIHYFIGRESNAKTAAIMAEFLVSAILKEGRKAQRNAGQGNDYFRAFGQGAANRIEARVRELRKAAEPMKTSTGMSLVVIDQDEQKANDAFIVAQYAGELRRGRGGNATYSQAGYTEGQQYGNSVSMTRQLE